MMGRCVGLVIGALLILASVNTPEVTAAPSILELMKRPGHISLMRHAWAPFEGAPKPDSPGYNNPNDCSTQRNLDDVGRKQARRLNGVFAEAGLAFEHIYTSVWCRCQETADLIAGRKIDVLPQLNSFFRRPVENEIRQLAQLRIFLNGLKQTDRALLVTHGSFITALAKIDTAETEVVVIKRDGRGGFEVVGHGVP